MHFPPNFILLVVFLATLLQTALSVPCQTCQPGANACMPFLEYCSVGTIDPPSPANLFEGLVAEVTGERNYAPAVQPPTSNRPAQTSGPRSQTFGRPSCMVDYLFGLRSQLPPSANLGICRLRQPFVLAWVALAASLMVIFLCCLCQCCCGCCCGGSRSTSRGSGHARGDVVMVRA